MSEPPTSRFRILGAATLTLGLFALGIVCVVDHARLSRLERSVQAGDNTSALANLSSQYESLAADVEALRTDSRAASEQHVAALKTQWEPRLSALEEAAHQVAAADDRAALTARVDDLEKQLKRALRRSTNTSTVSARPPASAASPTSATPDPPFLPLGIELRGGERFLTIVPAGAASIAEARALRPGDREGSWILERLERDSAEFRIDGQLQRLRVPR